MGSLQPRKRHTKHMSETKNIEAGNQPFTTTDAELALSLLTAGCTFAGGGDGGPAQMHFTPEICRNRWVTQKDAVTGEKIRVSLLPQRPQPGTGRRRYGGVTTRDTRIRRLFAL